VSRHERQALRSDSADRADYQGMPHSSENAQSRDRLVDLTALIALREREVEQLQHRLIELGRQIAGHPALLRPA